MGELKAKKVLVVEDDRFSQLLLCQVLSSQQIDSVVASNGLEALEILEKDHSITHIALDLNMPVMDGYEFLKNLGDRKMKNYKIYITSCNSREHFSEIIGESRINIDCIAGYFMKPFAMQELVESISND